MAGAPLLLAEAVHKAGLYLTAGEVAEVCWLAGYLAPDPSASRTGPDRQPPEDTDPGLASVACDEKVAPDQPLAPRSNVGGRGEETTADQRSVPAESPEPDLRSLHLPPPTLEAAPHDVGVPIRAPGLPALPKALALSRALRPLKRRAYSRTQMVLDEEATGHQAAESRIWLPVWVPAADRWLDLAVVVDDAASMVVWRRIVKEFLRMLQQAGAFRDVRIWRCDTDEATGRSLTIRGATASATQGRDPRELIDSTRRRAILVVSDCVGAAWGDSRMVGALETWGTSAPVAVVQPLPHRLWERCHPQIRPVELRSPAPALTNDRLEVRLREANPEPAVAGVVVPVFEVDPRWLSIWAGLVAGGSAGWSGAMATFTGLRGQENRPAVEPGDQDANAYVAAFRAHASPQAFRLARFLSAAPLSLPVIRLVQAALAPASRPAHLAEVFLGGLLQRLSPTDEEIEPDDVQYDFYPGVRDVLLAGLSRADTLRVISTYVSDRIATTPVDFLAMLTTPQLIKRVDPRSQPFAQLAASLLRALGGTLTEKIVQLDKLISVAKLASETMHRFSSSEPGIRAPTETGPGRSDSVTTPSGDLVTSSGLQVPNNQDVQRLATPSGVFNVPPRIQHFVGRKELLQQLRERLVNRSRSAVLLPRAVYGLGGVGKTTLAIEYAHLFRDDYDLVWWISAEDPAEVRRSLVELAKLLRIQESTDAAETVRRVLRALKDGDPYRRWLLVFDNATEPETLADYQPAPTGHVLVTSRNERWAQPDPHTDTDTALLVDRFTPVESRTLLQQRVPVSDDDADRIANRLEHLPLAIELASAWQQETRHDQPVNIYLRLVEAQSTRLAAATLPEKYPRPVAAALGVALDELRDRSPAAAQLVQHCAFLGSEAISTELLWRGRYAPGMPAPLIRTIRDRTTLRRALSESARYALVHFDTIRDRFQVHRLVLPLIEATLGPEDRTGTTTNVQRLLAQANPGNPDEIDAAEQARHAELSPHIVPSGLIGSDDDEARRVVLDQIRYRYLVGDYEGSRDLATDVLVVWKQRWGPDDELTLLARRHLANTQRALGDSQGSLESDEDTLARLRRIWGPDHDHTLATVNSFGADLRALGRFKQAYELDRENLDRHLARLGPDDPQTLRTANNLAVDLRLLGDFAGARALDEDAVARRRRLQGDDHPDTLFAISNLVRDLYGLGLYASALDLQLSVLDAHEAALTAAHPSVLLAKRSIALLYRKLGRFDAARERADASFVAYRTRFGERHENTLAAMMSVSNALRAVGELSKAQEYGQTALQLYLDLFPEHPFTDICRTNVAIVLRQRGDVAAARELNELAIDRLSASLGPNHPYTLCCIANYTSDLAAAGEHARALELSTNTLDASRRVRGEDHPYTLACANNHACDLVDAGRQGEADVLTQDTVRRFAANLGSDHPEVEAARRQQRIDCDIEPPPT